MTAIIIHQFGDPKQLKIEQVPTPKPNGNEVLVAVKAAAINPSDVMNVAGVMHGTTLPRIPGRDFAGVIVAGKPNLIGKEVFGTGGDIGFTRDGSHAQFILLPADAVTPKPAALSMDAAGSAGVTFVTAWSALVTAADVTKNDTVVIIGAAGGVGSAAVQIAVSRGARVIGAVRDEKEITTAKANGASDAVITSGNFGEAIRSVTGRVGAHVVFDTTGAMFAESIDIAAVDGRVLVITAPKDGKAIFNLRDLYRKTLRVLGVDSRHLDAVACAKILAEMKDGFAKGSFTVTPGKAYLLASGIEAYEKAAGKGGRVLLRPEM
jgi:NADPH:quinone reductase